MSRCEKYLSKGGRVTKFIWREADTGDFVSVTRPHGKPFNVSPEVAEKEIKLLVDAGWILSLGCPYRS